MSHGAKRWLGVRAPLALLIVSIVPITVLLTHVPSAAAYVHENCRQRYIVPSIWNQDSSGYWLITGAAESAWDQSGDSIGFQEFDQSGSDIYSTDNNLGYDKGITGLTTYGCSGGYMNAGVHVQYNTHNTNGYSTGERQSVMAHELGHALGLAHQKTVTCPEALMYPDDSRWGYCGDYVNSPQTDDVAGTNAWYSSQTTINYGALAQNTEWGVQPDPNSTCDAHFMFGNYLGNAYAEIKEYSGNCLGVKVITTTWNGSVIENAFAAYGDTFGGWFTSQWQGNSLLGATFFVETTDSPGTTGGVTFTVSAF